MKCNSVDYALDMFETEAKGLRLISEKGEIRCPEVIDCFTVGSYSYLLLEWIDSGQKKPDFWKIFARQLAGLHSCTNSHFGLDHNNYIGRLDQSNQPRVDFHTFYADERLSPQFKMAYDNGFFNKRQSVFFDNMLTRLTDIIPPEIPGLIHGDLWSGNFMTDEMGMPCLVDPSAHYGHREMDLAMSKLFGGFHSDFYHFYNQKFPLEKEHAERVEIFQLYYLLVHVNLFGQSYVASCDRIIRRYQ